MTHFYPLKPSDGQKFDLKKEDGGRPMPRHVRGRYTQSNSAGDRISTVQMPMRVHIGTTWWIRCVAKMQPYVKWPLVKFWGPGPIYACRLIIMNTSLCIIEYHRQILRDRWPLFTFINKYYLGSEMVRDRETMWPKNWPWPKMSNHCWVAQN